jgi:hypothetical protein
MGGVAYNLGCIIVTQGRDCQALGWVFLGFPQGMEGALFPDHGGPVLPLFTVFSAAGSGNVHIRLLVARSRVVIDFKWKGGVGLGL